jgi:DNA-binding transcriptional regulator YiaG
LQRLQDGRSNPGRTGLGIIDRMPNIATALKAEIARVARKEVKGELAAIKKASSQHRSSIAALRRKVDELERALKRARNPPRAQARDEEVRTSLRFRPGGLASHRKRLGLSAADFGRLLGVSGQSVYKWETGEVRPRQSQLEAIAAVRKLGKREALAKLEALS